MGQVGIVTVGQVGAVELERDWFDNDWYENLDDDLKRIAKFAIEFMNSDPGFAAIVLGAVVSKLERSCDNEG